MRCRSKQLWGGETAKAVENFPISGETVPVPVVHWLGAHQGRRGAPSTASSACSPSAAPRAIEKAAARDRRRQARRAVPDRRLPDRLGHLDEHERQRGDRRRSPARACTPTTTSTWASPPTTCSPRPCTSPRSTSRQNELLPALKQLERSFARKAKQLPERRQVGAHAPDGRRARSRSARSSPATPRRSRSAQRARRRRARRTSGRSRSAAPPPAPG